MAIGARKPFGTAIFILNEKNPEILQMAFYFAGGFCNRTLRYGPRIHFERRLGGLSSRLHNGLY